MKRFLLYLFATVIAISCSSSDTDDSGSSNGGGNTPATPTITLSKSSITFDEIADEETISFTSSVNWVAEIINDRADSWLSVSPTSGVAGDANIKIKANNNDSTDERSASIRIKAGSAQKTINVTQKQKDALTVTSSKFEITAEGGEVKIEVKANIDFQYEIEQSAKDWVKYKGTRAMKTSTLTFSVAENDDTEKREGKIAIKGGEFNEVVTIYQAGGKPSIVISQNEYVVSSDGETISVEVSSNVDVAVEMPTDADWISENTTRATSTNTYRFDIQPNEDYDQRTAEIKFTNKENGLSEVVAIKQMQRDAIVLADSEYEFGIDGGNLDFEILTNVDVAITISDNAQDWIQQVETRGLEAKALYFNVAACSSEEDREGTITISGGNATQTITVKQSGLKEILEKEREALIALYNATGGDYWKRNDNWCSDKPVSEWWGVSVYTDTGLVCMICLDENNLYGKITSEIFDGLTKCNHINLTYNCITSLEIKNHDHIQSISCGDTELSHIHLENVDNLSHLGVNNCRLKELDVAGLTNLTALLCYNNQLSTLDVKNNSKLVSLYCSNNNISSLDVSNNQQLGHLSCYENPINALVLSNNPDLTILYCNDTKITTLDTSNNTELYYVSCQGSPISLLDFSNNPKLETLLCGESEALTSVNISKNRLLNTLWCFTCANLNSIDLSACSELKELLLHCNPSLSHLDITNNPKLEKLWCYDNNLSELDLSNNISLKELICGNMYGIGKNCLTNIDISKNKELTVLSCYDMQISSIDVSKSSKLEVLECTLNPIKHVDVSKNHALKELYVRSLNINSIDVSNNPNLTVLECGYNPIYKIDVSRNYNLEYLYCSATPQTKLDVSFNPYLKWLATIDSPNLEYIYITEFQGFKYLKDDHTKFIYKDGADNPFDLYESTDYSKDGEVKILQSASKGNGIDIVLTGDGYSDRLIADGTYDKVMNTAMEKFFMEEPYKSYRDHFNVYSVVAVSENEVYNLGSSTAFAGYFGGEGTTLVGGNDQKVFSYAEKAIGAERMNDALIVVMMNSKAYAGTCYMYSPSDNDNWGDGVSISYFPIGVDDNALAQVLHHEAGGHGFSKLADEYEPLFNEVITEDAITSSRELERYGWHKNIDFTSDPTAVKWSRFLTDIRYANEGLGVYEGAFVYTTGAYRPSWNSIMRYNTGGFNAPSREAIYYRIHKLAYGEDWEYDYEKFVEYDAINRKTAATTRGVPYRLDIPEDFKPLHPPVVMNTSWRNAKNNAPAKKTIVPSGNTGNAGRNLQKVSMPSVGTAARKTMKASTSFTSTDGRTVTVTTDSSGATKTTYSK
ncbi:MAG: hypothetical protein IKU88_05140 [Alistipes sp.]|nr:hypothetical protein [Alistipes sp.]